MTLDETVAYVLSVLDVNGDGGEDWIADYAKFTCEGDINPMCDEDGCTLQIYLWDGSVAWNLAFEESVQRYRFGKIDGKPVLFVTFPGDACGKSRAQSCVAVCALATSRSPNSAAMRLCSPTSTRITRRSS